MPQARPSIAPMIVCQDVDKTYDYFTQVLGFAGTGKMPAPPEMGGSAAGTMHAEVVLPTKFGTAFLMLSPYEMSKNNPEGGEFAKNLPNGPLGNGVVLYLTIPDVDKYHAFIKQRGAMIDEPPTDQFWGDRTISVRTPDGYYLSFASPIKGFKMPPEMAASATGHVKPAAPGASKSTPFGKPPAKAKGRKTGGKKGAPRKATPRKAAGRKGARKSSPRRR